MQSATILIGRVQELIKDGSFGPSFILEKLNDGLFDICDLTSPPSLVKHEEELVISSGEKYVAVPSDFFGSRLFGLYNQTEDIECKVVYRLADFVYLSKKYAGIKEVRAACVKGRTIHFAGIPDHYTTLLISHMKEPTVFSSEADTGAGVDYLPPRIGENAIVAYAAKEIYAVIEDGVDGKKTNTEKWESVYAMELSKITARFGIEAKEAPPEQVEDLVGISGLGPYVTTGGL